MDENGEEENLQAAISKLQKVNYLYCIVGCIDEM
jgi:hypothetical protein